MKRTVTFDIEALARAGQAAAARSRDHLNRHPVLEGAFGATVGRGYPEGVDILRRFMHGQVDLTPEEVADIARRMNADERRAVTGG